MFMTNTIRKRIPIFCALDSSNIEEVLNIAQSIYAEVDGLKLGLEFFLAQGPEGIKRVAELNLPIFLDLKLHDIPNTVAGAIRSLAQLAPYYITVHSSGGEAMLSLARTTAIEEAKRLALPTPKLLAVTVLTSLDESDLKKQNIHSQTSEHVLRMAQLAKSAGIDGVICSPHEITAIRKSCGENFHIVVPGIRPDGEAKGDQKRVMSPSQAVDAGATALVIGRPIIAANNPVMAAKNIRAAVDLAQNSAKKFV